jgi:nucleotide-binding universal stress UspA family protein
MFKTLVVALDLEPDGDRALRVVAALARTGSVRVDLVTVSSPGMPTAADAYELERRAAQHGWDCDSWSLVHDVDAASAIVRHAAMHDDALLVMATAARQPWSSTLFGSVTRDVLRQTDRPVLLIGPNVGRTYDPPCTTLIPCIDASEAPERAVPAIVAWQQTFTSRAPRLAEVVADDADASAAEHRLASVADLLAAQHVHADTLVVHDDDPVTGLERLATGVTGPVYVATSARYTDDRLHWHSTTQQLIHRATCPVLVVPARPMPLRAKLAPAQGRAHLAFYDVTVPAATASS